MNICRNKGIRIYSSMRRIKKDTQDAILRKYSNNKSETCELYACTHRETDYAFAAQGHASRSRVMRLHASYFRTDPRGETTVGTHLLRGRRRCIYPPS